MESFVDRRTRNGGVVMLNRIIVMLNIVVLLTPPIALAGRTGELKRNMESEQAFREGRPPADLRYYVTGRAGSADAIIGLKPPWRQGARYWRELDPESDDLNRLLKSMVPYHDHQPRAFDIVVPDGEIVGVYWSIVYWTPVETGAENEVRVLKPRLPNLD